MIEFIKKVFWDGFSSGDFTYGITHMITIVLVIVSTVLLAIYFRNKGEKKVTKFLQILAIITLSVYLLRRTISFGMGEISFKNFIDAYWPFYLCNINTLIFCILLSFNIKKGQEFFLITGFLGGVITYLIPDGIFVDAYLTFPILDSILSHYILVLAPVLLVSAKVWKPEFKNMNQVILGLLLVFFNAEVFQRIIFGKEYTDYLFFHNTIPFTIPGYPQLQFLVISISFLSVILLVYSISYVLTNVRIKVKANQTISY